MPLRYTKKFVIPLSEATSGYAQKPFHILNMLQDAADGAVEAMQPPAEYWNDGCGWMLMQYALRLKRPLMAGDVVTINTGHFLERDLYSNRRFVIADENGEELGRADSHWIYVNLEKRRPLRLSRALPKEFVSCAETPFEPSYPAPKPVERVDSRLKLRVRLGELDVNGHVNNAYYLSWAAEAVPQDVYINCGIVSADIVYKHEAVCGMEITISTQREGLAFYQEIHDADGTLISQVTTTWSPLPSHSVEIHSEIKSGMNAETKPENKLIAAADVGGHTLTVGLIRDGVILKSKTIETPPQRTPQTALSAISAVLDEFDAPKHAPLALAVPGMVSYDEQIVECCPNQHGWNGRTAAELSALAGRPVLLANDCDCAAVGEMSHGAAVGLKNFVYITLGTGIGGTIIVNGEPIRGLHGRTGEIGHMPLLLDKGCGCGGRGHVESFFSADVFESAGEVCGYGRDMRVLWENRENPLIARYFDTGLRALACAVAALNHLLDPEAIVFGGGLSHLDGLLDDLRDYMQPVLSPSYRPGAEMRLAKLEADAPLLGAAILAAARLAQVKP